jgi:hypothetical protein
MHRASPSQPPARYVVPKSARMVMVEDERATQMYLKRFFREGARAWGIELDIIAFDSVEQMVPELPGLDVSAMTIDFGDTLAHKLGPGDPGDHVAGVVTVDIVSVLAPHLRPAGCSRLVGLRQVLPCFLHGLRGWLGKSELPKVSEAERDQFVLELLGHDTGGPVRKLFAPTTPRAAATFEYLATPPPPELLTGHRLVVSLRVGQGLEVPEAGFLNRFAGRTATKDLGTLRLELLRVIDRAGWPWQRLLGRDSSFRLVVTEVAAERIGVAYAEAQFHSYVRPMTLKRIQVLTRIAAGWPHKAVAEDLNIKEKTIESHLQQTADALDMADDIDDLKAHAIARRALQGGWITLSDVELVWIDRQVPPAVAARRKIAA